MQRALLKAPKNFTRSVSAGPGIRKLSQSISNLSSSSEKLSESNVSSSLEKLNGSFSGSSTDVKSFIPRPIKKV
jgi:hypothetical protein